MPLNLAAIGATSGPTDVSWNSRDVMLYALGVGAGQADALAELDLTTENTADHPLRVLPTFALVVAQSAGLRIDIGQVDRTRLVHALQQLDLPRPLPIEGSARIHARIEAIEDKGSGALVTTATTATDPTSGQTLFTARAAAFIRGEGGFDPSRKSAGGRPEAPTGAPDFEAVSTTRADQALLYRLCADRNPLHSDPAFAARGGFSRPILHGLCTYGISVRLLLQGLAGGDPARLRSVSARFTKPVLPGETLRVQGRRAADGIHFRTVDGKGDAVLDGGLLVLAAG